ncbi:protein kinase [Myxococcus sp. AM011]|uniref:serine/threonine-protein kinase n=1 Tax=Myxococcus sp. AM011 TaxID=2745200 RepID=UPI001595CD7A|nr:serine/threonine-protein kinase [Myxococcus sp. AM011]NVJ26237.1 protein kinase [Myxococcus sp. AM011]
MDSVPAKPFGRYSLVSRLGKGGMAEAWRAQLVGEAGVTKPVLIKKVLPEYAQDERFIQMFISEARISASLSHGNIAQVFDFGRSEGEHFLAMELVDGPPLHRIIKRALQHGLSAVPVAQAVFIAMEICRGLHYAHTRKDSRGVPLGIVHRDISPENVLVSYEGQVKIVDFGIAKARELRGFSTEPGVVKGKYLFFSPEQARGEEVDARTDVWAAGVVLYQMLCGRLPLQGPQYVVMHQLQEGRFPSPRTLRPELPGELEDIIQKALAVRKEVRFESAHAFAEALSGFLYATTPRFSPMSVAWFIQTLFTMELREEGREPQVPTPFREDLARAAETRSVATLHEVPVVTQISTRRWTSYRQGLGVGLGAALLFVAGLGVVTWGLLGKSGSTAPAPVTKVEQVAAARASPNAMSEGPGQKPSIETKEAQAPTARPSTGGVPAVTVPTPSSSETKVAQGLVVPSSPEVIPVASGPQPPEETKVPTDSPPSVDAPAAVGQSAPSEKDVPTPRKSLVDAPSTTGSVDPLKRSVATSVPRPLPGGAASGVKPLSLEEEYAAYMKAGRSAEEAGRNRSAITSYRKALALKSNAHAPKRELGLLLVSSFESEASLREGVRLLQDVVRMDGSDSRAWLSLGMAHESLKQYSQSEEALKRYLLLVPTGGTANAARAMLKSMGK